MATLAWLVFGAVWLATLSAFRRDPAWELVLEAMVFSVTAASVWWGERVRFWAPVAGLAAAATLGFWQLSGPQTALMAVRWLALAAWCVSAQRTLRDSRRRFLELAVHGAGAFALLSLVMSWTSHGRVYWWWPTTGSEVLGPFVNPNHFAVWCELMLAPAVWLATGKRQFWWAAVAIAAGGAASGSRAGLALMTLEIIGLLGLWCWRRRDWRLLGGMLAFPLLAALLGGEPLWHKLRDPEPLLYREQIWSSALTLWRESPWLGHGLGTFETVYPRVATFDTGELVDHAHNDWLEWGVEGGMVLVSLMLGGLLYAVRLTCWSPWLFGVPLAALHALVDYPMARLPILLWVVLLVTLAAFERPRFKTKQRSMRNPQSRSVPHKKGAPSPQRIPSFPVKTR